MPKGEALGEFEYLVMSAVLRLGLNAYGMRVRQEIAARTGRDVTIGAVYATLERLANLREPVITPQAEKKMTMGAARLKRLAEMR